MRKCTCTVCVCVKSLVKSPTEAAHSVKVTVITYGQQSVKDSETLPSVTSSFVGSFEG